MTCCCAVAIRGARAGFFRVYKAGGTLSMRIRLDSICCSSSEPNDCPISAQLLKMLVCPLSKEPLRYNPATNELVCDKINVTYPIVGGIPNLVPEAGRVLDRDRANTLDWDGADR